MLNLKKLIVVLVVLTFSLSLLLGCAGEFEELKVVQIEVEGEGVISVDGEEVEDSFEQEYESGETIELKVIENEDSFKAWDGRIESTKKVQTVRIEDDLRIIAEFSNIELTENTLELTTPQAENIQEVSANRDEITFAQQTELISNIEVGDILLLDRQAVEEAQIESIIDSEDGLLKEVVAVDGRTFSIKPAMLNDVIENGNISSNETMDFDDMQENVSWSEGVRVENIDQEAQRFDFEISLGDLVGEIDELEDIVELLGLEDIEDVRELMERLEFEEEKEFKEEIAEMISITGYVQVRSDTDFNLDLSYYWGVPSGLDDFELSVYPGFEIEKKVSMDESISWDEEESLYWEGEYVLGTIPAPSLEVYGPITINPEIELVIGSNGKVGAEFETNVSYDREAELGFKYIGEENNEWEWISEISGNGFTFEEPYFRGSADARAYSRIGFLASTGIQDVSEVGLRANMYSMLEAMASVDNQSDWQEINGEYSLDFLFKAEGLIDLEKLRLIDLEDYIFAREIIYEENIARGEFSTQN